MAEKPAQERSEEATPQRVRKARQEGKVPQAQEAASALMIMMLLLVLTLTASGLYNHFSVAVQKGLSVKPTGLGDQAAFLSALTNSANQSIIVIMPFLLGGAVVSVFASLLSSGWALSPKAIIPKAERISPIQGAKNLVSLKSVVKLVISILKLTVMVAIVYDFLDGKMEACLALRWAAPEGLLLAISRMAFGLMARLAVCLAAIAAIDLFYHKW